MEDGPEEEKEEKTCFNVNLPFKGWDPGCDQINANVNFDRKNLKIATAN